VLTCIDRGSIPENERKMKREKGKKLRQLHAELAEGREMKNFFLFFGGYLSILYREEKTTWD